MNMRLGLVLQFGLLCWLSPAIAGSELEIVRVDSTNHRVFVLYPFAMPRDKNQIHNLVDSVAAEVAKKHRRWGSNWSASFFSARHLVGYKDEPDLAKYVQSGEWQRGYLAEYSHKGRLFVLLPAATNERTELRLE